MPLIITNPNQIAKKIIAPPKSGWRATKLKGIKAKKPETKRCRSCQISKWREDKYFAKTKIKTIFAISAGWKLKAPKLNQPLEPELLSPKNKTKTNEATETKYKNKINEELLRKRQSKAEKKIKKPMPIPRKIICFFTDEKEGSS